MTAAGPKAESQKQDSTFTRVSRLLWPVVGQALAVSWPPLVALSAALRPELLRAAGWRAGEVSVVEAGGSLYSAAVAVHKVSAHWHPGTGVQDTSCVTSWMQRRCTSEAHDRCCYRGHGLLTSGLARGGCPS